MSQGMSQKDWDEIEGVVPEEEIETPQMDFRRWEVALVVQLGYLAEVSK